MDELFNILELSNNASVDDIKKQYKLLAMKYHPDKNGGDDEKFKKIQNAYEILTDDNKKQEYLSENMFTSFDINDLFSDIFSSQIFNEPIIIKLSLKDIINGCNKKLNFNEKTKCKKCNETGIHDYHNNVIECRECFGKGVNLSIPFLSCMSCQGNGIYVLNNIKCEYCKGKGYNKIKSYESITIPKNIQNNQELYYKNYVIKCIYNIREDNISIENNNIIINQKINLDDYLCGFVKEITLCDEIYYIQSRYIFDINQKYILKDNIYINFILEIENNIDFYKKLSTHLKELFKKSFVFKENGPNIINI